MAIKKDFKQAAAKIAAEEHKEPKIEEIPLFQDDKAPAEAGTAAQFISPEIRKKADIEEDARIIAARERLNIPEGWRLTPEPKTARMQLLIKPTTRTALKEIAARKGISVNRLVNDYLEDAIKKEG